MAEYEQSGGAILAGGADTCVVQPYIPCHGFQPDPRFQYVSRLVATNSSDMQSEGIFQLYYGRLGTHLINSRLLSTFVAGCRVETARLPPGTFTGPRGAGGRGCAEAQARQHSMNLITPQYNGTLGSLARGPDGKRRGGQAIDSALVAATELVRDGGPMFAHADLHHGNAGYTVINGQYIGCLADFGRILFIRDPKDVRTIRDGIHRWAQSALGVPENGAVLDPAVVLRDWIALGDDYPQCPLAVTRPLSAMWDAVNGGRPANDPTIQRGLRVVRGWTAYALTGQRSYLNCGSYDELVALIGRDRPGFVAMRRQILQIEPPPAAAAAAAPAPATAVAQASNHAMVIDDTASISRRPGPGRPAGPAPGLFVVPELARAPGANPLDFGPAAAAVPAPPPPPPAAVAAAEAEARQQRLAAAAQEELAAVDRAAAEERQRRKEAALAVAAALPPRPPQQYRPPAGAYNYGIVGRAQAAAAPRPAPAPAAGGPPQDFIDQTLSEAYVAGATNTVRGMAALGPNAKAYGESRALFESMDPLSQARVEEIATEARRRTLGAGVDGETIAYQVAFAKMVKWERDHPRRRGGTHKRTTRRRRTRRHSS